MLTCSANQPTIVADTQIALAGTGAVMSETKEGNPITVLPHSEGLSESGDREGMFPTDEEKLTLRKIPGHVPKVAFLICVIEFAERASWYGVIQVFGNYVRAPLPAGGNGAGAPKKGTQDTAGALGQGNAISNAIKQS